MDQSLLFWFGRKLEIEKDRKLFKKTWQSKTTNKSLTQLGVVIKEFQNNQVKPGSVFVSFLNSKLIKLMQSYLSGNSKTTILVVANQNPDQSKETVNPLKFAVSAQTVQTLCIDRHGRTLLSSMKMNMTNLTNLNKMIQKWRHSIRFNPSKPQWLMRIIKQLILSCIIEIKLEWCS